MTTDIERQFFETFNIKRREYAHCCSMGCTNPNTDCDNCEYHEVYKSDYPEITDRILLELICILNNYGKNDTWAVSVENLKDCILVNCIKVIKEKDLKEISLNNFKHQIQALFKEI